MPNQPAPTEDTEPAAKRVARDTTPPPIDETEDDTRIVFGSWDCALVPR